MFNCLSIWLIFQEISKSRYIARILSIIENGKVCLLVAWQGPDPHVAFFPPPVPAPSEHHQPHPFGEFISCEGPHVISYLRSLFLLLLLLSLSLCLPYVAFNSCSSTSGSSASPIEFISARGLVSRLSESSTLCLSFRICLPPIFEFP